jgi:tol-pal system protein YbgF
MGPRGHRVAFREHSTCHLQIDAAKSHFRRSFGYYSRPSVSPSSMMRTMLNRVAFTAIASACCVMAIPTAVFAQAGGGELLVRIDRLENQVRQLTGQIEQMQYRNQQLEAALQRLQGDNESRIQSPGPGSGSRFANPRPGPVQPPAPAPGGRRSDSFDPAEYPGAPGAPRTLGSNAPPAVPGGRRSDSFDPAEYPGAPGAPRTLGSNAPPAVPGGRRSDAFDPTENPGAPGAPRVLGSVPSQPAPLAAPERANGQEPTFYGSTTTAGAGVEPDSGAAIGAPARSSGLTGSYATTAAPSSSPRDVFDLGLGYLQHRDYALAEEAFLDFLKKYPSDKLAPDAQFGLGESLFQRQSYHDAANAFVVLSKKYEASAKAPEGLLRLGQSLAAINEKELACVAFGDVGRKYPRAPLSVKQAIEREQKRVRC